MIHYLTVSREAAGPMRLSNNDGSDGCSHDGIRAVELTVEQHWAAGGEPKTVEYPWHNPPKGNAPAGSGDDGEA